MTNKPLIYNDPTGNRCNPDDGCIVPRGDPGGGVTGGDLTTSSDPSQPSTIDPNAPANVLSLYNNVYLRMWNDRGGWWWDVYGSGGFTIWEFMAVMWGYEQQGFPNTQNYATALGNHGASYCGVMGCDIHTAEGAMQFMMSFSQVIPKRLGNLIANPTAFDAYFYTPAQWWQDDQMLIVESVKGGFFSGDPNALFDVGNVSMRSAIYRKMAKLGMIHTVWGQPGQDYMIILTYCQWQMVIYAMNNNGAKSINGRVYRGFCGG